MKYYGDGLLGYRDDEVRVSLVWEERGGKNYSVVCEVCVIKTAVKVRLLGHPDQQKCKPKKELCVGCTSDFGRYRVNVPFVLLVLAAGYPVILVLTEAEVSLAAWTCLPRLIV